MASRQRDAKITGETFHRWLTVARCVQQGRSYSLLPLIQPPTSLAPSSLLALSHGVTNLTAEHYFAAKTMDEAAQTRVAALPTRSAAAGAPVPSAPSPAARR